MDKSELEPENNQNPEPLSEKELAAFMQGLSFYLFSDLPETEKMEIAQKMATEQVTEQGEVSNES